MAKAVRQIQAQAPTRIDLAGGTLDLWPLHHLLTETATVNVAVTLEASVTLDIATKKNEFKFVSSDQNLSFSGDFKAASHCSNLPLLGNFLRALWREEWPGLTVTTSAKSPAGAGLGGSSALAIALGGALMATRKALGFEYDDDEERLVNIAKDVEANIIKAPTGVQDYWGAVRGAVNAIYFPPGYTKVVTYAPSKVAGLTDQLVLCYSGKSRASAINNWEIFKRTFDGDKELLARLEKIGKVATQCASAMIAGDLPLTLKYSSDEWALRQQLWPNIETVETKALSKAAFDAGAFLARVCGAGGGGVMAIFAPKDKRAAVCAALTKAGGTVLDATVASKGLTVDLVE